MQTSREIWAQSCIRVFLLTQIAKSVFSSKPVFGAMTSLYRGQFETEFTERWSISNNNGL